ncbi:Tet(A)/Tet(B)/Tet(C) family tetracycline efflux MFS transporter [Providencia hangzhouensis]|uniref:Tet(A)/Tet(B)/Tet(C) family tetracycline efflux MFS transporter n=1 Tax=Providencia rettgeri TaxID=587 RepID=A0AAJ4TI00_PRORE|nr:MULTISPECIES: Tet(A)/Tet(B)/Tet(C) family tetracycline efflux MFS transporter [Providencia]MBJ9972129.1 Tet(A)/Tet(B)/Tet(C) family tetracycline efflux MFS transporter [Providencia rettgeri]MCB6145393.1 Tet(A)/Tet(B)/Tet(C) family tetracycline efflux MFS transporter [Providencia rettgeri]MCF8962919.1 Tetracycline resistance protein, class B [Providencia rettgeri]QWQ16325.1 Tet(A)/Tet(B)/Tet(C) family tetracycline efflux MFS transporter [Providencia rettgeri]QWQ20159.1 Tet(A)/Tet(B)/Tet(C) f
MNKFAITVLMITALDAMGIGLIMPVLPALLREYVSIEHLANHYGILLALYAIMQVFFAPILGKWSDKFGRRPILLLSLAGAALDYTLLALSSSLWMLYLGRLISGITGATGAVAASVIADNTLPQERTKWFGRLGAAFGIGLIAGPAIGGFAGQLSPHLPFVIAAILNACSFVVIWFIFKDQRKFAEQDEQNGELPSPVPFMQVVKPVILLLFVFFIAQLIGQIPATTWVLFTENRFQWNSMQVGLSLAGLGVMHTLFQAFVAGAIAKRFNEKVTIIVGFVVDEAAFIILSLLTEGWMIYPTLVLLAGGSIALPALQGLMSAQVNQANQGKLQGILVSLTNATGVIGPLLFSFIFGQTLATWDGWVWLIGAMMYVLLIAFILSFHRSSSQIVKITKLPES